MLKFLKKLFNADVTIAPVVTVIDEEIKTFDSVNKAISGDDNEQKTQNTVEDISGVIDEE